MWEPQCHCCVWRGLCDGAGEEEKHHCTAFSELSGERQTNTCPLPSPAFHVLSHPFPFLYIPCALLSSYSSLQWNIREGMDSVPETRSRREEPSVILSLTDSIRARVKKLGPITGTLWVSHNPSLHCLLYNKITLSSAFDHPGVLWSLGMSPCGKAICDCRWEGRTNAVSSNNSNRDTPAIIDLCIVGSRSTLHKC